MVAYPKRTPPKELLEPVRALLKLANDNGKFAIQVAKALPYDQQQALEWMQLQDWIRLIDVTPVSAHSPGGVFRVFLASTVAKNFMLRPTRSQ